MDNIANMLSSIKNASMIGKEYVELPYTKVNEAVLKIIKEAEFITDVRVFKEKGSSHKSLHVDLAKDDLGDTKIREVKQVSKPGQRIFKSYGEIKHFEPGIGVIVVSTSRGVLSGNDAKAKKLGGEVICEIM